MLHGNYLVLHLLPGVVQLEEDGLQKPKKKNKDDNIHKSSEMEGQTKIITCRVSELNKKNMNK